MAAISLPDTVIFIGNMSKPWDLKYQAKANKLIGILSIDLQTEGNSFIDYQVGFD